VPGADAFLRTLFPRHDPSKTLEEINAHLEHPRLEGLPDPGTLPGTFALNG